jgi:small subunit ribosomal protein S15
MPIKKKKTLIEKFRTHKEDTGSTDVQVAIVSERIDELSRHLKKNPKDNDSRRGLLSMVGKRRRLLNYLQRKDANKYLKLVSELGLRK